MVAGFLLTSLFGILLGLKNFYDTKTPICY